MSVHAAAAAGGPAGLSRRGPARNGPVWLLAAVLAALGLLPLVDIAVAQSVEARANGTLLNFFHVASAQAVDTSVIFFDGHLNVGYTVDAGCTATLLVIPFFLLTALLMVFSRVSVPRCLAALAAVTVVVFATNQLRLLLIAVLMRLWGPDTGYSRGHVFLGTVLSTVGVLVAVLAYVLIVTARRGTGRQPGTGHHE